MDEVKFNIRMDADQAVHVEKALRLFMASGAQTADEFIVASCFWGEFRALILEELDVEDLIP